MDIRWKKYSHSLATKVVVFLVAVLCFTGIVTSFVNVGVSTDGDFGIVLEKNYYHSMAFMRESEQVLGDLTKMIGEYKSEKHILSGGTISEDEVRTIEENLYYDFRNNSSSYNPNLSEEENFNKFREEFAEKIAQAKDMMIKNELRGYHFLLQRLEEHKGLLYYASDGTNVYTNSTKVKQEQFKNYPSYMIFDRYEMDIHPTEIKDMYWIPREIEKLDPGSHTVYVAFTEQFFSPRINEWKEDKVIAAKNLHSLALYLIAFMVSLVYLVLVTGRNSFGDKEPKMNAIDRLFNDINLVSWVVFIALWVAFLDAVRFPDNHRLLIPITIPIATVGLVLFLSLVRHFKNKTLITHTLVYSIFNKLFKFVGDVYASGSVGVKTVLIVVGYPLLVALTFFMFPVTLGIAAWFAFKKIRSFNTIKEGVEIIKGGDIHHRIDIEGSGEFAGLAANINSITDGLKKAVNNELKSERLKTELITNVSHDIRTPLTSIITYVDLLKNEKDPEKTEEYVKVLDQKSQRLKILTDDLFEASKASSGDIPVHFDRIDIVSLITQGLGEVNAKIEALDLAFKLNHPEEKVFVKADGKLLWRSIENLLSNIFKYALRGSRVYIDIEDLGQEVRLTFKNISAYELNISAEELMERFKRGDESRHSQGSGLGLSIAKSLIEVQQGKFQVQVDGDLFKVVIAMPKYIS